MKLMGVQANLSSQRRTPICRAAVHSASCVNGPLCFSCTAPRTSMKKVSGSPLTVDGMARHVCPVQRMVAIQMTLTRTDMVPISENQHRFLGPGRLGRLRQTLQGDGNRRAPEQWNA